MLYVFHGTDLKTSLKKSRTLADSLRAKRSDATFVRIEADDWSSSVIEEHVGGQGLFSNKYIVFLDRVTENADAKEDLSGLVEAMNQSANIFIVLEGKLNAELKRAVDKDAEKAVLSDLSMAAPAKKEFNVFALADAFARRDAVNSWKIYREAIDSGVEPENIAGVLFWKAKASANLPALRSLVTLYHEGHRGIVDLERGIEKLLLGCAQLESNQRPTP